MKTANPLSAKAKSKPAVEPAKAKRTSEAASDPPGNLPPGKRHDMIATAAYFRAEQRGFAADSELENWLAAEAEIDRTLSASSFV